MANDPYRNARFQGDRACELYTRVVLDQTYVSAQLAAELEKLAYAAIGNYAYALGYNGSVYMAPLISDRSDDTRKYPRWVAAVELDESCEAVTSAWTGFPYNRLVSVISDILNIADIMHQHGIKV